MVHKEDRIAPIGDDELELVFNSSDETFRTKFLDKLFRILNERQDGYFGILTNISQLANSENENITLELGRRLALEITRSPQRYAGRVLSTKIFPKLADMCPKFVVSILEPLIRQPELWFEHYKDQEDVIKIQVMILKFIRVAEEAKEGTKSLIPQITIQSLLKEAIDSCDDVTKLDAITLALESRQTTRILTTELELFKVMFVDALGFQEPSHRQKFLALTSRLINRIKDSLSTATRYKKFKQAELDEIHANYNRFLSWLIDTCFNNVYYNAYFGSFILTMSTLKIIVDVITFKDDRFLIRENFKHKLCFDAILGCLTDSFEDNKQLALDLLITMCKNHLFDIGPHLSTLREIAYELSGSVNPASSLTAKYIFRMLIDLNEKKEDCLYNNLFQLTKLVEESIASTKNNFIDGVANHPIYPRLTCIRALLEEIDFIEVYKKFKLWKELVSKIIRLLVEACDCVSALVCNLNPESIGHLPMDLKPVTIDSLSKAFNISVNISESKYQTITSQMLLISGWKTIKECSLSMGAMCNLLWWMHPVPGPGTQATRKFQSDHQPLIDFEDMTIMINFFNHYLRNLRHRGAFEQAYNGFLMLAKRVWSDERYRALLSESLRSIMLEFKGELGNEIAEEARRSKIKSLKAYTTRRSAGLPFIVQAILVSEHRHDSENLRWVADCLFSILDDPRAEEYQKVHCLNILKALINEHQLGEKVAPYIERTFIITIESFGSESFPIRNCANMLLSAVVGRTFGCSRLKNDIHRKNKLSFECFFSRYPRMLEAMLRYLELGLEDRHYLASVHTIIILLNRLHPSISPSEQYSYDKVIRPFLKPMTSVVLRCPDLNLRKIAAKLCVRLESFCLAYSSCRDSLKPEEIPNLKLLKVTADDLRLKLAKNLENEIHGSIILLNEWIKFEDMRNQPYYEQAIENVSNVANYFIKTMFNIFSKNNGPSYSLMYEFFNLMETYLIYVAVPDHRPKCASWELDLPANIIFEVDSSEPSMEDFIFKYLQVYIMFGLERKVLFYADIEKTLARLLSMRPDRKISTNFHSALIRMIRLSIRNETSEEETEFVLTNLDIDTLTNHESIYDKLRNQNYNENDRQLFREYIDTYLCEMELYNSKLIQRSIFNLVDFPEFQPIHNEDQGEIFSSRISNTPRAIEVLALMSIISDRVDFIRLRWSPDDDGSLEHKLVFLTTFIQRLPECDVKFIALFCSAKLIEMLFNNWDGNKKKSILFQVFLQWSSLIDIVADGSSCLLSRQVCGRVLKSTLHCFLKRDTLEYNGTLVNIFSALIKLMEDDDSSVRLLAWKSMSKLNSIYEFGEATGSRMEKFINVITHRIFNPDIDEDWRNCYNLMIRIIFIHSKGLQEFEIGDQERLFDKCKLNTCADYVAITAAARKGLCDFIKKRSRPINLTEIELPILELIGTSQLHIQEDSSIPSNIDILKEATSLILADLTKLTGTGYRRILLDASNSPFEFAIYKRIAFLTLMLDLNGDQEELNGIRAQLIERISRASNDCSTNLLRRCLEFVQAPHYRA